MSGNSNEEATDGTYGPWVVVTRKHNGTKNLTNGGISIDQVQVHPRRALKRNRSWLMSNMGNAQPSHNYGPGKEVKRKLSPIRDLNGPLLASSLQQIVKAPNAWKDTGRTGLGKEKQNSKPNSSVSVKGKKALARAKAIQDNSSGTTRVAKGKVNPLTHHAKD